MGIESRSERACLLIADISGYTSYMQGVELDHAQDVIADLLTAVVTPLNSHFTLNKLEGDAAFMYCPVEQVDGSVLLDMVENSYFGFRSRVRSIERATSCQCGACLLIPRLDLKIIVHHGTVAHQEMLGMDELVGPDVVLVHRLMKNDVEEATGTKAYALLTDSALKATALEPELLDMIEFEAEFEDIGPQMGWVHDLDKQWRRQQARNRVYVDAKDAAWTIEHHIADVPVGLVWEWTTSSELRSQWEVGYDQVIELGEQRRGEGKETHCVHGQGTIKETVVDWNPPRYVTYKGTLATGEPFMVTDEVEEIDGGVIVRKNAQAVTPDMRDFITTAFEGFRDLLEQWYPKLEELVREQTESMPSSDGPELPIPDEEARLASSVS